MCLVSFAKQPNYSALEKIEARKRAGNNTPKWAYIVICDDCSHGCSWCYGGFNGPLHQQMPLTKYRCLLDKLKEAGITQITLAGGEPTEHPEFRKFVIETNTRGFLIHVASHGEHIDDDLVEFMGHNGVRQVQLNWQGKRYHDTIHKQPGSYAKAVRAGELLLQAGVEVTANVTVGGYNLPHLSEIFKEASILGSTRLRVWEATGRGNAHRKGVEAVKIFEAAKKAAAELGYTHVLSYDPLFEGDITVPCLQFSGLYMYITSKATLEFCGAVEQRVGYIDCVDPNVTGADIVQRYNQLNDQILGDNPPYCPAREGFRANTDLPTPSNDQIIRQGQQVSVPVSSLTDKRPA